MELVMQTITVCVLKDTLVYSAQRRYVSQNASIMGHVITDTVFVQKGTVGQCVNMSRLKDVETVCFASTVHA